MLQSPSTGSTGSGLGANLMSPLNLQPNFSANMAYLHQPGFVPVGRPRMLCRVPRVVPDQKEKFDNDDLMKKHAREGEVRYTAFRERPLGERQAQFIAALHEGHTEIAFVATGFNLSLTFNPHPSLNPALRHVDYERERGKVHISAPLILNGVCVRWKGYLDLERLDGAGQLEFDSKAAEIEDEALKEQVAAYTKSLKEFEEHRKQRHSQLAALVSQHQANMAALAAANVVGNTNANVGANNANEDASNGHQNSGQKRSWSPSVSRSSKRSRPSDPFGANNLFVGLTTTDLKDAADS